MAVDGSIGYLKSDLEHYAYRDVSHHLEKMQGYASLSARQLHESGRRASALGLVVHPPAAFVRNYLLRGGFTQGSAGLTVSALNAFYVFLKLAKLRELDGTATQDGRER